MNGYSAAELARPKKDTATIVAFFTTKGKDLYCTCPAYQAQIKLKNIHASSSVIATILGSDKELPLKNVGQDCVIDLSGLKPDNLPSKIFTINLKGALK